MIYRKLFSRLVSFSHLATNESVEQNVTSASHRNEVAVEVANLVGNHGLQTYHDCATEYHGHENTTCGCGVFAKAFNRHVEDTAPHH